MKSCIQLADILTLNFILKTVEWNYGFVTN